MKDHLQTLACKNSQGMLLSLYLENKMEDFKILRTDTKQTTDLEEV